MSAFAAGAIDGFEALRAIGTDQEHRTDLRMALNQIGVSPNGIARVLGAVALFLILASTAGQLTLHLTGHNRVYGLIQLFYVDNELNVPTFFSTLLLLIASLLLSIIAVVERKQAESGASYWVWLSLGFLFLAMDETASLHERLVEPIRRLLGDGNLGVFYYAWVIPGIAIVLVLALCYLKFLFRLPAKTCRAFLVAASLYISGAIGLELIGGRYAELNGRKNLTYSMIATVEECLEMAGVLVFIWALLVFVADRCKEVRLRFGDLVESADATASSTLSGASAETSR